MSVDYWLVGPHELIRTSLVFRVICLSPAATIMSCENPRHNSHLKAFLKKFPSVSPNAKFTAIDMDPLYWWVDLTHPEKNTAKCCRICSIQEDIKRVTSPEWKGQPAPYDRNYLTVDGGEFTD